MYGSGVPLHTMLSSEWGAVLTDVLALDPPVMVNFVIFPEAYLEKPSIC